MINTHTIKKGWGYWDVTNYPVGGCFRRAASDFNVAADDGPAKTSHGYLMFFRTDDGKRIAADERAFEPID